MELNKDLLIVAGLLGIMTGLVSAFVAPLLQYLGRFLSSLIERALEPYDYTRGSYFQRQLQTKGESGVAKQVG